MWDGARFRFAIEWRAYAAAGSPVPAPSHRTRRNGAPAALVAHARSRTGPPTIGASLNPMRIGPWFPPLQRTQEWGTLSCAGSEKNQKARPPAETISSVRSIVPALAQTARAGHPQLEKGKEKQSRCSGPPALKTSKRATTASRTVFAVLGQSSYSQRPPSEKPKENDCTRTPTRIAQMAEYFATFRGLRKSCSSVRRSHSSSSSHSSCKILYF